MFISSAFASETAHTAADAAHHAGPFYTEAAFWVAVAFVVVVGLAFRPVGRALGAALDARAQRIRTQLDEARKLREDAQALLADYQRKQRDALQEAEGIVAHAKAEAARQEKAAAEALENAIARREQQAMERIAQAEAQAMAEVRNMAVDLAVDAAQRLIIQKAGAAQGDVLIDSAIRELPGKLH